MSESTSLYPVILETFRRVWGECSDEETPEITNETVLLETGLDSLDFAVFVTDLEDQLGYDPFALSPDAYYPQTFGEFVAFYEKYASHGAA